MKIINLKPKQNNLRNLIKEHCVLTPLPMDLFNWLASAATPRWRHRLEQTTLEWFVLLFCTLLRMSPHRFQRWLRFPLRRQAPYSSADRMPAKQLPFISTSSNEWMPDDQTILTTYMQSASQFSFVSHFHVDFLIQTETDQIQWLLHRNNLHLKMIMPKIYYLHSSSVD